MEKNTQKKKITKYLKIYVIAKTSNWHNQNLFATENINFWLCGENRSKKKIEKNKTIVLDI